MDKQLQALQNNLESVAQRAVESCKTSGHAVADHFRGVTKMIELGSGTIAMGKVGGATP